MPGGKLVALVVDDRDVMAGKRAADRAGLRRAVGEVAPRRCSSRPGRSRRRWSCPSAPRTRRRPLDRGSRRSRRDGGGEASGSARASGALRVRAYSAGDWQRMLGPSRKSRSSRSSASNSPSWRTTSAPRDHGPMTVFHIVSGGGGVGRAPHGVAAADVEPVLGLDASRERGAVRVRDVLARASDARTSRR